ncbi:MAG: permease, partial [Campylobacterota bacterium]|nr:permease [Campylobacterota bacterium]
MKFRGLRLLSVVGMIYLLLFLYDEIKVTIAVKKAAMLFGELMLIFPLVIIVMALITYYVNPGKIASHLGEESGVKGWAIALSAG